MKLIQILIAVLWGTLTSCMPYEPDKGSSTWVDTDWATRDLHSNITQRSLDDKRQAGISGADFYKMFRFVDTVDSPWPEKYKAAIGFSLVEALGTLRVGYSRFRQLDASNPGTTFLRYFSTTTNFDNVGKVLKALAFQLGAGTQGWQPCQAEFPQQLPLNVYYHLGPPGLPDRADCEDDDTTTAYMTAEAYTNKPVGQMDIMIICKSFFEQPQHSNSNLRWFRPRQALSADKLDPYASMFGREPANAGIGGMMSGGQNLLHELFHWQTLQNKVVNPPGRTLKSLQDWEFKTRKGNKIATYGPWAAQELARVEPDNTIRSVENYVWMLEELVWKTRKQRVSTS